MLRTHKTMPATPMELARMPQVGVPCLLRWAVGWEGRAGVGVVGGKRASEQTFLRTHCPNT